ncbi:DUF982 domain-containing protein [Labrys sp. 22185]|uniref:DUF982 domain-containing protein n=1 Tax=Labrys sp. 22185 TaxID=3453888 RepID=UPI003F83EAB0
MHTHIWSNPVRLKDGAGQPRTIATTEEAANFLLLNWPIETGEKFVEARRTCEAFIDACEEAGLLVLS